MRVGCFKLVEHQKQKSISSVSNIWATKWEVHTLQSSEFDCSWENPKHSLYPVHCQSCPEFKYASSHLCFFFYLSSQLFFKIFCQLNLWTPAEWESQTNFFKGGKNLLTPNKNLQGSVICTQILSRMCVCFLDRVDRLGLLWWGVSTLNMLLIIMLKSGPQASFEVPVSVWLLCYKTEHYQNW